MRCMLLGKNLDIKFGYNFLSPFCVPDTVSATFHETVIYIHLFNHPYYHHEIMNWHSHFADWHTEIQRDFFVIFLRLTPLGRGKTTINVKKS